MDTSREIQFSSPFNPEMDIFAWPTESPSSAAAALTDLIISIFSGHLSRRAMIRLEKSRRGEMLRNRPKRVLYQIVSRIQDRKFLIKALNSSYRLLQIQYLKIMNNKYVYLLERIY
ncbi:hypothetical protein Bca52824_057868 [Brassica carinata]|uniref:Uncharacterized protein n=1 Tax=Brassica carinata TaxID=52824 RepID=A0A8X7QWU1_BRACI|nr:hypothetical protein Bca52824_057868 [Brassica carinata]